MAKERKEKTDPDILKEFSSRFFQDRILVGLAILAAIFIGVGIYLSLPRQESSQIRVLEEPQEGSIEVVVDVSGAVVKPGVYKLPAGARVSDAIGEAGGFAPTADSEFISKGINLAQKVSDGAKIYIPKKGETVQGASSGSSLTSITGKININSASQSQLESLPAIGPVTAGKIIAGRPYSAIDDLLAKKIVGQKTFEKIKGAISVF